MTYATILVNLRLGDSNTSLLQHTARIASRFHCSVIGIAVAQPMTFVAGDGYVCGELSNEDREQTEQDIAAAQVAFRSVLHPTVESLQWISDIVFSPLADYVARASRSADLILTQSAFDSVIAPSRVVSTADLVLRAGRAVLMVPDVADLPAPDRILVAWKDTREARRAISDALPMLKMAQFVTVLEIAPEAAHDAAATRLEEVVAWLGKHRVNAHKLVVRSTGEDASQLRDIAQQQHAHVIVAGAYGHSRMREWVLGGVTSDLLLHATRCALVSH